MTFLWILIGAILFVVGAIVVYFAGIRSLQASRRLADYRVKQKYVARARWSLVGGLLSLAVAALLFFLNRAPAASAVPTAASTDAVLASAPTATATALAPSAASQTSAPVGDTPTSFVITASPEASAT